jgi:sugar/nucleoside kinase (ribokinase family)
MSPSAKRPTVVVLGGINMDLVATAARMPAPGALAVTRSGAQEAMPPRAEVDALVESR